MSDEASAFQAGVIQASLTALLLAGLLTLSAMFSPETWLMPAAHVIAASVTVFWIVTSVRLTGSHVISELPLNYPDLRPAPSIHNEMAAIQNELTALREAIEDLRST